MLSYSNEEQLVKTLKSIDSRLEEMNTNLENIASWIKTSVISESNRNVYVGKNGGVVIEGDSHEDKNN